MARPTYETPEDIRTYTLRVARAKGWELNPDEQFTRTIEEGLLTNYRRFGCFLCPCRDIDTPPQQNRDILCPCRYAQADIDEFGHCFCGLFVRKGFGEGGERVGSIPERRPAR